MALLFFLSILFCGINGGSRYFMDDDSVAGDMKGILALPIDVCFQSRVLNPEYMRYTCSPDGQSVNKTTYADPECAKQPQSITIFDKSSAQGPCGLYNFECEGEDAYIVLGSYYNVFGADDDTCSKLQNVFPTALGCFCTSDTTSFHASCSNDTYGVVTAHSDTVCGAQNVTKVTDHSKCHHASEHTVPGLGITVEIYAEIQECAHETKAVVHSGDLRNQIMWVIVGASAGGLLVLCGCIGLCCCLCKRRSIGKNQKNTEDYALNTRESSNSAGGNGAIRVTCCRDSESVTLQ